MWKLGLLPRKLLGRSRYLIQQVTVCLPGQWGQRQRGRRQPVGDSNQGAEVDVTVEKDRAGVDVSTVRRCGSMGLDGRGQAGGRAQAGRKG